MPGPLHPSGWPSSAVTAFDPHREPASPRHRLREAGTPGRRPAPRIDRLAPTASAPPAARSGSTPPGRSGASGLRPIDSCRRRPAAPPAGIRPPRSRPGADPVAIRSRALQLDREPVAAGGPVAEEDRRLILADDDGVDQAVVIEISRGEAAAQVERLERSPRAGEASVSRPAGRAHEQLDRHLPGKRRPVVADVAVGRDQVEPAVVVCVEERDAEAQQVPAGRGQSDRGGLVGEDAPAQVAEQRGGLAVVVGDGQVGAAVAVEVAAGDAHPRLETSARIGRRAGLDARLLEPESPLVAEQVVRRHVVGDVEIDAVIVVEVGRDHPQPAPVRVDEPGRRRDIHETTGIVAEDVVRQRGELLGVAVVDHPVSGVGAEARTLRVERQVMADVEVEVAVAVEVGERGRRGPVAVAAEPDAVGDVLERPVAPVAQQANTNAIA